MPPPAEDVTHAPAFDPAAPREAHDRFSLFAEAFDAILYDVDVPSGRVERLGAIQAILGYQDGEIQPTVAWWADLVHPDDLASIEAEADSRRGSDTQRTEYRVRHRDGTYRVLRDSGRIVRDAGGRIIRRIGTTVDVTDLRAAADAHAELLTRERAARDEADRLRFEFASTFDHAPIGVAHTDRDHRWLRFNRKMLEITGYPADELRDLDWRVITHPDDLPLQLELERRMLGGEIPGFTIEKRYIRRDGSTIWVRLSTATVKEADLPVYSVAAIEDISERKRRETDVTFLADLDRRIRPMTDPREIAATAVESLAGYLAVDRCVLRDVDVATLTLTTAAEWAAPGLAPLYAIDRLTAREIAALEDDRTEHRAFRVDDVAQDPQFQSEVGRLEENRVRAMLGATFVEGGRWVSLLTVATVAPRAWRDHEAELVQAVVDRVWPRVAGGRAADQLRESEERYRAIVLATASTVFRLDADGRADDAFAAWWLEQTGQGRAELSGWGWLDVVAPEDRERVRTEQERGFASRKPFESSYRLVAAPGDERHMLVRGVPILTGDGDVREWFGTVTDVTDRRRQQADLARQANLLDQAHDAFVAWEIDGPIFYWNHGAERLYGYTEEEALGQIRHELLRTELPNGHDALLSELEATGAVELELVHIAKGGRPITVRSRHQLVEDGGRRIVLVASRDVTELRALERAQQGFTAAASHDLKNPLSTIKAETQLMLRRLGRGDQPDPDRMVRGLTTIDRLTDTMAALVDDLVDVAMLSSNQPIELRRADIDLGRLVDVAVDAYRPQYDGEILVDLPGEQIDASVDERRLARVLANLLANAVKFSPDCGPIQVALRRSQQGGRPVAKIAVRDVGVGIPEADLPVVFERFRRGSNVGVVAGTGIGLAGARQIVELHGGQISVESVEGEGSTFTVTLPLDDVGKTERLRGG